MTQVDPSVSNLAHHVGVVLRAYGPGDGVTRYRFLSPHTPESERDYFAARQSYVLGTALGRKDALAWLRGYQAAREEFGADTADVTGEWEADVVAQALAHEREHPTLRVPYVRCPACGSIDVSPPDARGTYECVSCRSNFTLEMPAWA